MSKIIPIAPTPGTWRGGAVIELKRLSQARTTTDYRRLLSEMRVRPASQRAFLRKLLKRALVNGVHIEFPVSIPVVGPT